jgi:hypothetical protein
VREQRICICRTCRKKDADSQNQKNVSRKAHTGWDAI